MSEDKKELIREGILKKATELGADLVGIARVADLKHSPSHLLSERMPEFDNIAAKKVEGRRQGVVEWPEQARSAVVIAIEHPEDRPELDWWILGGKAKAGNTPGNRVLMKIVDGLSAWLEENHEIGCFKLPYHIEHGGIYMKDAAVLAGLGCVGKNNILITPQFGPRQRLRVMLLDVELPSSGPSDFDPCTGCNMPCRKACPQNAFTRKPIYTEEEYGIADLPGRSGVYSRALCSRQMDEDTGNFEMVDVAGESEKGKQTKFCRACELSCPVGRRG
jgi:epoxyqueuosine reductase